LIALSFVGQLLARSGTRRILAKAAGDGSPGDRPGAVVLKQAGYFLVFACIAGAITVAAAVGIAFADTPSHLLLIIALLSGFGGMTLFLAKETRLWIEIDAGGIQAHRPWRGAVRFGWTDVEAVLFSQLWAGLVIRASQNRELIVPIMVVGSGSLIEALRAHVAPAIWTSALAEYNRVRSRAG
jgi:hypothetical protein